MKMQKKKKKKQIRSISCSNTCVNLEIITPYLLILHPEIKINTNILISSFFLAIDFMFQHKMLGFPFSESFDQI